MCFRRRCCHKDKEPTLRDLYKRIWGPEESGSDRVDPDGLNRLADAIGEQLNHSLDEKFDSMLSKFHRFSLGTQSKPVKSPKLPSETPLRLPPPFKSELKETVQMRDLLNKSKNDLNGANAFV
jgi:hypothetical protein